MAYNATNPNGQTTSANSSPVVIASDNVVDIAGNQVVGTGSITVADTGSASATGQSSQSLITGTPTSGSVYSLMIPNVNGAPESFSSVVTHITGTFVGTYWFERSPDGGTTWTPFNQFVAGQAQAIASGTLPGMFHGNVSGVTNVRVRCTAYTSGTITVRFSLGIGTGTITVGNPIRLYDMNNNSQATIKPASTAPVATDTAIVTTESQNSPLLTGTLRTKLTNDIANATGSITTATSTVTTVALSGVGSATVSIYGTYAGVNVTFEGSDSTGTNWVTVPAQPIGSVTPTPVTSTGVLTSNSTNMWNISPILGLQYIRVRATAWTSGSASVIISPSAQFTQPIVSIGSGSINASLNNDATVTGSLSSLNAAVTSAALNGVSNALIQVTGTWAGTLTPQGSVDGTNYVTLNSTGILNVNTNVFSSTIGSGAVGAWIMEITGFNYFKVVMSSYSSGTAVVTLKTTSGAGMVNIGSALPGGSNTIGSIQNINGQIIPGTAATNLGKAQGNTPGTTDTGVATLAVRAPATPVARTATAGNYELLLADQEGKLIDQPYADPANGWYATTSLTTSGTSTLKTAGAAGIRSFITSVSISNSSASATLATLVDGTTTPVIWQSWIAAGASVNVTFPVPLRGSAATVVSVGSSVAVTTLYVAASGFIGV